MATLIELEHGRTGYRHVLDTIRQKGQWRSPRGSRTLDMGHTTIVMKPYNALPIGVGRNLKPAIAAAETLQLIAAQMDPILMTEISPNFIDFTERDGKFHGAYGVRVGTQIQDVIRKLNQDPSTRQAVITLWDPDLDNVDGKKDYPCTVALGFEIIDGELNMNVLMRSNDAWLGFPYDIHNFTQLQLTLSGTLGTVPGIYTHTAWSFHLYDRHVEKSEEIVDPGSLAPFLPSGIGDFAYPWENNVRMAKKILSGGIHRPYEHEQLTQSERWYYDTLAPYVG